MSEKAAFTVTLPTQETATSVADHSTPTTDRRVIYLKSASFIARGKSNQIILEKIYDSDPNGEHLFDSLLTFVIAIGKEKDPKKSSGIFSALFSGSRDESLPVFPSATIKLDKKGAYIWAGSSAAVVAGGGPSILFPDASEIASHLATGESLYLRITVRSKDRSDSSLVNDVEVSPSMVRLGPAQLGVISPTGGAVGKNVIPESEAIQNSEKRRVAIGWRPLQMTGETGIFLDSFGLLPRIFQHWSVCIGDYYHELVAIDDGTVIYRNGRLENETYQLENVGYTTLNDQALVEAGIKAIHKMDMMYSMRENNCQKKLVTTSFGFSQQTKAPKYEKNPKTGKFELVNVPPPPEEKLPEVNISLDLFDPGTYGKAGRTTEEAYLLSEEERQQVLDRALDLMGGGEFEG